MKLANLESFLQLMAKDARPVSQASLRARRIARHARCVKALDMPTTMSPNTVTSAHRERGPKIWKAARRANLAKGAKYIQGKRVKLVRKADIPSCLAKNFSVATSVRKELCAQVAPAMTHL